LLWLGLVAEEVILAVEALQLLYRDVVEAEEVVVVVASNIPLRLRVVEEVAEALAQLSAAPLQPVPSPPVLVGNWPPENRMPSLPRRAEFFSKSSN
jgi:hypothetical protein